MTRRQRTMLFSGAAALFFVISPAIIFYAAGYRFDFAAHRLIKTGGLSITATPQPVNAYVNGKLVSSNNFVFRNIFISNLLPKNYAVQITKDGYFPWQKTFPVEEGQVTEALNITLFPQTPQSEAVASNVNSLSASPDGSLILFTQGGNAGETLFLAQGHGNALPIKHLAQSEVLDQVFWAQDNSAFLISEKINSTPHLLLGDATNLPTDQANPQTELQDVSSFIPSNVLARLAAGSAQFSQDKNFIYLLSSAPASRKGIYVLELDTHTFQGLVQNNVNGFLSTPDGVYILANSTGLLSKCSADLTSCSKVSQAPLVLTGNSASALSTDGDHIALIQDKKLYIYQPDQQGFALVTDNVNAILFSPDKQKIAVQKDREVSVYWLKDIVRGEQHKLGDLNLLLRISEKITGMSWLADPYQYIAIESNDALRIAELDGRDKRNIISYPQFSSAQNIVWQKDSANLLLTHSGTLVQDFVQNQAQ